MRQKKSVTNRIADVSHAEMNGTTLRSAKNHARPYLGELRDAMAEGWQIVQPIFARPHWSSLDDQKQAFHFVLQRERVTRLMTIPDSNAVERFIRDRSLLINQR